MTSRAATAAVLAALFLSTGAHATPRGDDESRPGQGFGPPPREGGEHGQGSRRPQLFISPAGEPFRGPADAPYPVTVWFSAGDTNHDGALSRDEFVADAGRFFTVLDTDKDGVIDGFEVSAYERNIAPEILQGVDMPLGGARGGRNGPPGGGGGDGPPRKRGGLVGGALQGAAPYALLAEPQPVMGADVDFNRRISREEAVKAAKSRFSLLDADKDALLRVEELPVTPVQARRR
jgi:hypothetical protein